MHAAEDIDNAEVGIKKKSINNIEQEEGIANGNHAENVNGEMADEVKEENRDNNGNGEENENNNLQNKE